MGGGKAQGLGSVQIDISRACRRAVGAGWPPVREEELGDEVLAGHVEAYLQTLGGSVRTLVETNIRVLVEKSSALRS